MPDNGRTFAPVKLSNLREAKDGQKFTKAEREENRAKIADLRLRGVTFQEIGRQLGISTQYAYSEFKVVEDRWRASAHTSIMQLKQRELARLDMIEREAWAAYERSQQDATELQQEYANGVSDEDGVSKPLLVGTKAKKKGRDGDAKWLEIVLDCIDRRIKLIGLDREDLQRVGVGDQHGGNPGDLGQRVAKYQGLLGIAVVAYENGTADRPGIGESLDSARSALEAGGVLDVDGRVRETTP